MTGAQALNEKRSGFVFQSYRWQPLNCPKLTQPFIRRKPDKEARKAEKRRLREEENARQVAELSVYSATDNPFHDTNLGQQFKWHKKAEKEKKQGLSAEEARRRDELRRLEAKVCWVPPVVAYLLC